MMPIILNWDQIEPLIAKMDISDAMKKAFIEYSNGNAVIPPVGELIMHQLMHDQLTNRRNHRVAI